MALLRLLCDIEIWPIFLGSNLAKVDLQNAEAKTQPWDNFVKSNFQEFKFLWT